METIDIVINDNEKVLLKHSKNDNVSYLQDLDAT